jgi:hypothetical protein
MEDPHMKRENSLPDGSTKSERLDDVTPQPKGGGGGQMAPREEGYMETWDVLEAPHPTHAAPLPLDDNDDEW